MNKIIEKTVESKYAPHDTNVSWLDVSGDKPVKKYYINGKWVEVSGGGGASSSNPTEADVTKVWQVTPVLKETKTETFDILHEYTDTFHFDANLIPDAINLDKFTEGSKCTFTVGGGYYDGNTYDGFIEDYGGELVVGFSETPFEFYITQEGLVFNYGGSEEELTLSLSVEQETPIYDYNWAPGVKVPIPTAEDEGKILVVNKVEVDSKEYELAPTQTATITEETVILQNTSNLDKFVEGNTVNLVIDGTTCTGQVIDEDGALYVEINNGNTTLYLDLVAEGTVLLLSGNPGTYEVSVSVLAKEYSYEYQLQSGGNNNGLSIPPFKWEDGDTAVFYETLPKVNDIIYFTYSDRRGNIRLFPIVVTNIRENALGVSGTFMQFGNYYVTSGSTGSELYNDRVPLDSTTFGDNFQVNIAPVIGGYAVSYVAGHVG